MKRLISEGAVHVLALPRAAKRVIALVVDAGLCILTVWLAFYLRLDEWVRLTGDGFFKPQWAALASLAIALPLFIVHGFYRMIFRYSGLMALKTMLRAFALYGLLYATVVTAIGLPGVPRTVGIIQPMLLLLFVSASRLVSRLWLGEEYHSIRARAARPKALVYGTGRAGRELVAAMAHNPEMQVVGYLDDDRHLHGHLLDGLPVYDPSDLDELVITRGIHSVFLAMPDLPRRRRNAIIEQLRKVHVTVRTLPSIVDLVHGKVSVSDLRELDVDDLLGREPVQPDPVLLAKNIAGKAVMVTGAGGSIGSELCRQIVNQGPRLMVLIEHSEFALYRIYHELEDRVAGNPVVLVPILASVCDRSRMRQIMQAFLPDTVYHAAAYKHVPLVEQNLAAGVENNVLGTLYCAQAACTAGVSDFVLISTDKAVRPTSMMGASKRLAEMVLQSLSASGAPTCFSMVRFGNVLDSSGSVVPKFRQQIREGGPITLTHPEVTRYFMSIPEAAQLVIQAGAMAEGGDVFLLDMGEPVKIMELARRMVELSGLTVKDETNPDGDIEIAIVGLRPGEKLYEELLIGNNPQPTQHPRIMKAHEEFIPWSALEKELKALQEAIAVNEVEAIRTRMQALVTGYQPDEDIVDWTLQPRLSLRAATNSGDVVSYADKITVRTRPSGLRGPHETLVAH